MKLSVWNDGADKAFVFGDDSGPTFVAITDDIHEALHEWDERFGRRVEPDDPDLADYGPDTESAITHAVGYGDIRINDGGTTVWVNHYEWVREFEDIAPAFANAFGIDH